jgi:hypothetical protein
LETKVAKKIGWLVTDDGFQKTELLEDNEAFRKIKMIGGASDGTESIIPAAGMPNGELYPCFYEGDEEPKVWRFKGRTLPIVDLSKFKNPEQARLLVPEEEPYMFLPHTTQVIDGVIAGDHQLLFGPTGVGKTSILTNIAARIMQPTLRVNFTGQVSISDVVGSIGIVNGSTALAGTPNVFLTTQGAQKVTFWTCHHGRMIPATSIALNALYDVPNGELDDLVQDVFLSAMRQLRGLRTAAAFKGWLAAIARNRAMDYFRASRSVNRRFMRNCVFSRRRCFIRSIRACILP